MMLLLLAAGPACAAGELNHPWIRGIYAGKSPRPVVLPSTAAWRQAHDLARRTADAIVLVGSGASMQPLYQPGTILVVQSTTYEKLERGQTAFYRNQAGQVVAHVLITKARDGWRAAGLNNRSHDMEPVVADNLLGVVIAAFQPVAARPATYALR